jgi:hypothetical protein
VVPLLLHLIRYCHKTFKLKSHAAILDVCVHQGLPVALGLGGRCCCCAGCSLPLHPAAAGVGLQHLRGVLGRHLWEGRAVAAAPKEGGERGGAAGAIGR